MESTWGSGTPLEPAGNSQNKNIGSPQNLQDSSISTTEKNSTDDVLITAGNLGDHKLSIPFKNETLRTVYSSSITTTTANFPATSSLFGNLKKSEKQTLGFSTFAIKAIDEEDERTLFCAKAKLYKFLLKKWEDRGVGDIKLMKNKKEEVRLLMKRDQVSNICDHHRLTVNVQLTPLPNNDKAWLWMEINHTAGIPLERLFIEFKFAEEAQLFNEVFEKVKISLLFSSLKIPKGQECSKPLSQISAPPKPFEIPSKFFESVTQDDKDSNPTKNLNFQDTGISISKNTPEFGEINFKKLQTSESSTITFSPSSKRSNDNTISEVIPISSASNEFFPKAVPAAFFKNKNPFDLVSTLTPNVPFVIPQKSELGEAESSSIKDSVSKSDCAAFKTHAKLTLTEDVTVVPSKDPILLLKEKSSDESELKKSPRTLKENFLFPVPATQPKCADVLKNKSDSNQSTTPILNFKFGASQEQIPEGAGRFSFKMPEVPKKHLGKSEYPEGSQTADTLGNSMTNFSFKTTRKPENLTAGCSHAVDSLVNLSDPQVISISPLVSPGMEGKMVKDKVDKSEAAPVPDKIEVKNGEEGEEILYKHRENSFRFDSNSSKAVCDEINLLQNETAGFSRKNSESSPEKLLLKVPDIGMSHFDYIKSSSTPTFPFEITQTKSIGKGTISDSKVPGNEEKNLKKPEIIPWMTPNKKNDPDFVSSSTPDSPFDVHRNENADVAGGLNSTSLEDEGRNFKKSEKFPSRIPDDRKDSDPVSSSTPNSFFDIPDNENKKDGNSDDEIPGDGNFFKETKSFPWMTPDKKNYSDSVLSSLPDTSSYIQQNENIAKSGNQDLNTSEEKKKITEDINPFFSKFQYIIHNADSVSTSTSSFPSFPSFPSGSLQSGDSEKVGSSKTPASTSYSAFPSAEKEETAPLLSSIFQEKLNKLAEEAICLFKQKKFQQALDQHTKLIELSPSSGEYYFRRAECYMTLNQYETALNDAKKTVELKPYFIKGHDRLIKIAMSLGIFTEAESAITKLSEIDPSGESLKNSRQSLSDVLQSIKHVEKSFAEKNYDTALENINKVIGICSHNMIYKVKKGECLSLLGRYTDAENFAKQMLCNDRMNIDAEYIVAFCQYQLDPQKAIDALKKILLLVPDHRESSNLYKKAKRFIDMKREGNEAFDQKNYYKAHQIYVEAIAIDPCNKHMVTTLYSNMAQASYKMGKVENAIDECTRALEIDPIHLKTLMRRVQCYMDTKEYEEAIEDISKVLELDPRNCFRKLLEEAKELLKVAESNYHEILGAAKCASAEELKEAYRKKALLYHPDRHADATEAEKKKNERKFKNITRAYRFLTEGQNGRKNPRPPGPSSPNFKSQHEYSDSSSTSDGARARPPPGPSAAPKNNSRQNYPGPFSGSDGTGNFPQPDSPPSSNTQNSRFSSRNFCFSEGDRNDPWSSPSAASSGRHICKCKTGCPAQCGCRKKGFTCTEICGCWGRCPTNSPGRSNQIHYDDFSSVRTTNYRYSGQSPVSFNRHICKCTTGCPAQCGCRKIGISCTESCGCSGRCSSSSPAASRFSDFNYCNPIQSSSSRYSGSLAASSIRNTCGCRTLCPGQCGCRRKGFSCHSGCGCGGMC